MQLKKHSQLATAIVTLLVTTPLWATNGYFTHGIGTKNKGMAGAGIAMPEDAISVANNPAASLDNTGKYDLGIAVFSPSRSYNTSESLANGACSPFGCAFTIGPNDIDSSNNTFFLPHMAGAWQINDNSAWSAAFYAKGGMNTTWKGGFARFDPTGTGSFVSSFPGTYGAGAFGGNGTAGVDLMQAFLDVGYAHSAGESFTWGVSLIGVMQVFAARGVATFGPYTETFAASGGMTAPDSLSNNGHDTSYGLGVKLGFQWDLGDKFALAASYTPKIDMSEFKDYSDLFAEDGDFDIPADLKAGITFRPNDGLAFSFDIENIWYSDVDSVANPFSNLFSCPTAGAGGTSLDSCLGGKTGAGFGWEDMLVYKLGVQWASGNDWTWRAGYSFGDQPIPETEVMFNILAPGVIDDHITFGLSRGLASGNEMSMSFMWAFNNKVSGRSPFDPSQTINLDMDQWEIEFAYGWR